MWLSRGRNYLDISNAGGKSNSLIATQFLVDVLHMSRNKYRFGRQGKYGSEQTNYVY